MRSELTSLISRLLAPMTFPRGGEPSIDFFDQPPARIAC